MRGKCVIEVPQRYCGIFVYGLHEALGETVGQIYSNLFTPDVGVAGFIGVGGCDEQCAGDTLAGLSQTSALAGLDHKQHLAVRGIGQYVFHLAVGHKRGISKVE